MKFIVCSDVCLVNLDEVIRATRAEGTGPIIPYWIKFELTNGKEQKIEFETQKQRDHIWGLLMGNKDLNIFIMKGGKTYHAN